MKIFMTGATGLVGRALSSRLEARGDTVLKLSRHSRTGFITADPTRPGDWQNSIRECDVVVNLAGANLFDRRWDEPFKKEIRESRIQTTRLIAEQLAIDSRRSASRQKSLISTSAVGYYGPQGDEELTESSPPGRDFMARVCVDWEAAAEPAVRSGVRVVHPRLGIVLDRHEGALPQLIRPFKFFVGGRVGSGRQWVSWIHIADLVEILIRMIDDSNLSGPINAVSPHPVTNHEMSAAVAKVLGRPNWLPAPAYAIRLALGEVAEVVTAGQRVIPSKLRTIGFPFRFPTVQEALADLLLPSKA